MKKIYWSFVAHYSGGGRNMVISSEYKQFPASMQDFLVTQHYDFPLTEALMLAQKKNQDAWISTPIRISESEYKKFLEFVGEVGKHKEEVRGKD